MNKNVFIEMKEGVTGRLAARFVAEVVADYGLEIAKNKEEADIVLKQVSSPNALSYYKNLDKNTFLFTADGNGLEFYNNRTTKIGTDFVKGREEGIKIDSPMTEEEDLNNTREIIEYLLGKKDEITIKDILGQTTWDVLGALNKGRLLDRDINKLKSMLAIDDKELEQLKGIVKSQVAFDSSELSDVTRKINTLFMQGKPLPNMGDSLIANLINANTKLDIAKSIALKGQALLQSGNKREAEEQNIKLQEQVARVQEEYSKAKKTVRLSLQGSKAFGKYAKEGMENMGVYSLYIPDPTLADNEIKIPHPTTVGAKQESYPEIGEVIMDVRHPITTIMLGLKVVGYTLDGSIRTSVRVCLAYYGDADGDAHSASWNPWNKYMEQSNTDDLDKFCKSAGIEVDDTKEFTVSLTEIEGLLSDKTDDNKLANDGLSQAAAKKITKSVTGSFGAVERNLVFNSICNAADMSTTDEYKTIHNKSWLSQIPVQAKNILEDLRNGNIDDMTKDTLLLFEAMSKDTIAASLSVANLLGMTTKEAFEFLNELKGVSKVSYRGTTEVKAKELNVAELFNLKF